MKKKTYQQPKMKVVMLDQADIIATSGEFRIKEDEGFDGEDW